ncbi:ABC transporter substrate-binding protein [Microtetraspora sp. NBRC 16547]|uniref:ABC transporter substrate-binding protein n=1 Tax=Microtetraspora sp. NBRC 16547 TaxID=3030993 RepID=UPI0024A4EDAF|nr:ABC transporter substrate-binding protein [Microtetraspora sp. NBRC 16547]GLX02396.1 ABC transporter substrate-binding protein [Microtetraspora sp. NBRC 16547]
MRNCAKVIFAASLSLGLAACGGAAGPAGPGSKTADRKLTDLLVTTPAAQRELDKATWNLPFGEPASLDPIKAFNYPENTVVANLCEGLMRLDPDYSLQPNLAEKVETSDQKTWVYTLRDGVRFWDGEPMTAEDVLFSLRRHLDAKEGSYWASDQITGNIASIEKTGDRQVTITLKKPDATLNSYMATPIGVVVEKKQRAEAGAKYGTPEGGVMCTGPYTFSSWEKGATISMLRNDAYWDTQRRAKTKQVDLRFIVDPGAIASALETGAIDGSYDVPVGAVDQLSASSNGTLYLGKSLQMVAVISTGDGALGNPAVRRALALATDREAIAETVFAGTAQVPRSLVPRGGWTYGQTVFDPAYDALPDTKKNLDEAKKLVAGAGAGSAPITIAYPSERQFYADILSEMSNAARELGLTIQPKGVPSAQYGAFFSDAKARAGYDGFMTTNYMDIPDPLAFLRTIAAKGGSQNFDGSEDPQIQNLIEQAAGTLDEVERATAVSDLQAKVMERMPWIPVAAPSVRLFLNKRVTGVPASFVYLYYPWAADLGAA